MFLSYFIFEATTGKRVHPAQYVLVGIAQNHLLSSPAVVWPSGSALTFGFLLAGAATVCLLRSNAAWIFNSRCKVPRAGHLPLLYVLIYLLLRLEDNALLVGAVASFLAVAAAMYFTRGIDWYSSLPAPGPSELPPPPLVRKENA